MAGTARPTFSPGYACCPPFPPVSPRFPRFRFAYRELSPVSPRFAVSSYLIVKARHHIIDRNMKAIIRRITRSLPMLILRMRLGTNLCARSDVIQR